MPYPISKYILTATCGESKTCMVSKIKARLRTKNEEGEDAVDGWSSMPPKECAKFLTINILYIFSHINFEVFLQYQCNKLAKSQALRLGWIVLGFGVLSKGGSYGYLNNKS